MLSTDFVNLVISSTRKAIKQTGRAGDIEQSYAAFGGNYYDLEEPAKFDRYSGLFFKSIAKHILQDEERNDITIRTGKGIYDYIKRRYGFQAGRADDLDKIKENLGRIIAFFVESGYIDNAQVIWDRFNEEIWQNKGLGSFELVIAGPVILPSAQRLYKRYGFAQHYLSRTIENALRDFSITGKETKDFNPNHFSQDKVVELWKLIKF